MGVGGKNTVTLLKNCCNLLKSTEAELATFIAMEVHLRPPPPEDDEISMCRLSHEPMIEGEKMRGIGFSVMLGPCTARVDLDALAHVEYDEHILSTAGHNALMEAESSILRKSPGLTQYEAPLT